jgi:hypothetical protein
VAAGTDNSDEARDFDLNRFYLQPLPAAEAAARDKESAQDIFNLKPLIDKKQWPYVMNDLRLRASYLSFDLKTVIASKPVDVAYSRPHLPRPLQPHALHVRIPLPRRHGQVSSHSLACLPLNKLLPCSIQRIAIAKQSAP